MSANIRTLQAKKAASIESARALVTLAEQADRGFTADEQTQYDALVATVNSLNARVEREQSLALQEAGLAAAASAAVAPGHSASAVIVAPTAKIVVAENVDKDPKRGFAHAGEFMQSVYGASRAKEMGANVDHRLMIGAAAPGTFGGEGNGSDGGFLIPPDFAQNIFTLSLGDNSLLPMTDEVNVAGNGMIFPKDETTPWGTNGIRAYWQGEAVSSIVTKPVFGQAALRLKKLMALVPVSDEMLADTNALGSYLPKKIAQSIQWKTNEAILFGSGNGTPTGAMSGPAVVTVAKESGQATLTLVPANVAKMVSRLPPGSYANAVWIINNDVLPSLFTMTLGNYPIYMPGGSAVGGFQMNPYGSLLGRPIVVSQHAKTFSSQGDVMLMDLSYYQTITKAEGISTASSMHLYFDADATAFRTTFRMDGQSKIVAPITPANGTNTLSPFVQMGVR